MKLVKRNHGRLRNLLARAYHERERPDVDELWQMRVMSHIRSLGPVRTGRGYITLFEQSVWRLAPVTGLLILILVALLLTLDFMPDYEMAKILIDDPVEFTVLQWFGV
jgi:hypothetical protein